MRRPTFASAFDLEYLLGVDQVLVDEVALASALVAGLLRRRDIRVLAARQIGVRAADGSPTRSRCKLLDDAKALADYVVIDSPPLTVVTDALPFAQLADEIVIVVRLDHDRRNRARRARRPSAPERGAARAESSSSARLTRAGEAYYYGYGPASAESAAEASDADRSSARGNTAGMRPRHQASRTTAGGDPLAAGLSATPDAPGT